MKCCFCDRIALLRMTFIVAGRSTAADTAITVELLRSIVKCKFLVQQTFLLLVYVMSADVACRRPCYVILQAGAGLEKKKNGNEIWSRVVQRG